MKTTTPQRAAIYARVAAPASASSLLRQVETCRAFAATIGATVVQQYLDNPDCGRSDYSAKQQLLVDAEKGCFDVVVVENEDRIGRDLVSLASFEQVCQVPVRYAKSHWRWTIADPNSVPNAAYLEDARFALIERQVAARKARAAKLETAGLPAQFPYYKGKRPKIGRSLHAKIRNLYNEASMAGADRTELATILNRLAHCVELGRKGAVK